MSVELKSGYFNAVLDESGTPDITYSAEDLNEYFEGLISKSGVFYDVADRCQVVRGDGLNVKVREGKGQVNFHWFKITEDTKLELSAADVILDRKDRIIVRCDKTNRNCVLMVLEGTPSSNPVAPAIGENDISLATITIKKNATEITSLNITDERANTDVCGWITGLIYQVDTSSLFYQYQAALNEFLETSTATQEEKNAEYEEWFNNVQEEVKATSLYREYEAIYKTATANEQTIPIPSSINYKRNGLDILNVHVNGLQLMEGVDYNVKSGGSGWSGTAVPNSGTIEKIYFNNNLSNEEVENILMQLDSVLNYLICSADGNIQLTAMKSNETIGMSIILAQVDGDTLPVWVWGDAKEAILNEIGFIGFNPLIEEFSLSFTFEAVSEMNGNAIGTQNELLKSLISITPFEYVSIIELIEPSETKIGTKYHFINKKSIDGTAVEGVEAQIEDLQEQVNNITFSTKDSNYYATGSNDNIAISNIVKSFLNGTGDYSSVKDYASMHLYINGELGIENLIENQMVFDFHNTVDSNRKVFVDFGNATINFKQMESGGSTIAIFGSNNNVVIEKANIYLSGKGAATFYVFHGGIIKDCVVDIEDNAGLITTMYGVWNAEEVSNSKFNLKPKNTCYGIYECDRVQFNDILTANGVGYCAIKSSNGFVIGNSINHNLCSVNISDSVVKLANKGF